MRKTKHKKNGLIVAITIILLIVAGITIYLGYGATMINPKNEKSIINHLSADKNNPIKILETKEYNDRFAILYTDPLEAKGNEYSAHLQYYVKNKYYSNRFEFKAGTGGSQTQTMVLFLQIDNDNDEYINNCSCFIGNVASEETKCSVFELDENLLPIRKLDELDVPQTSYIFVKEYELKNKDNEIVVYDGAIDLKELTGEE